METKFTTKKCYAIGAMWLFFTTLCFSQNDVMMQAFYWNLPVDQTHLNGYWWDSLRVKTPELKSAGIAAYWLPSPCKGNWGIEDMGYGIYDLYDLGAYNQKGSTETRFGSKTELLNLINTCHQSPRMDVYADAVLNHNYGEWGLNEESNPAVKAYVFGEAHNGANVAYQTSDIKWVIPNATAGDYYIQIKGYNLNWGAVVGERGYNLNVNWTAATETDPGNWESEPNNGNGQTNNYPGSGITIRGHAGYQGDIDEYKVTLTSTANIIIKLTAMRENTSPSWQWVWADQANGYYPVNIWYNGSNIASTKLEAHTVTKSAYPTHTGTGEANFQWGYADFHPADANDWLGDGGYQDAIIPNTRWFGNDFNTYSANVQSKLNAWGQWMVNTVGFDGFRLDFVRGYQVDFIANWINALPKVGGTQQRYIVGEYWTGYQYRLKNWVNDNASHSPSAAVAAFDFPLKFNAINSLCNGTGASFDMRNLNHAGMVRDNSGNNVASANISTFVDNHDSGKEHDKWIFKDWALGYAYILTHEGRPCIFYPHFYGIRQVDNNDASFSTQAPVTLKDDIKKLIFSRKTYMGGTLTVLSEVGNPYPAGDAANVYIARRAGNGTKSGAIIVLNNHDSQTKGLWVSTSPSGWANWANLWLKNEFNPSERVQVQSDGRVYVQAPARGYAIYVLDNEYVTYTLKSSNSNDIEPALVSNSRPADLLTVSAFPNPASEFANINIYLTKDAAVTVNIYNTNGQLVANVYQGQLQAGTATLQWTFNQLKPDLYICKVIANSLVQVVKIVVK
jgi:alpha-amylase